MARSVRHLTEIAALLEERGIDLVVLKQGIDTTTPAGRFTFHVLAAMDEMLADLISESTKEGLASARARGRVGGRKPKLTARQAEVARGMYDETGADGRRKYTVAEIAETFGVSRKTVYRHLEPSGGRRQPGKSARPAASAGPLATLPYPLHARISEPASPRARRACHPGLPGLRARTRHQARGAAATRGPRHRLAAPRRSPRHRSPALRGMPAARARHRRELLRLRRRPPDHRAATRTRRPTRAASTGLAARPRLAASPPAAVPRRSQIASVKSLPGDHLGNYLSQRFFIGSHPLPPPSRVPSESLHARFTPITHSMRSLSVASGSLPLNMHRRRPEGLGQRGGT